MSSQPQKLTKRQKKSLIFRQRGKLKAKPDVEELLCDAPVSEYQEMDDDDTLEKSVFGVDKALDKVHVGSLEVERAVQGGKEEVEKGAGKGQENKSHLEVNKSKKRKRKEDEEEGEEEKLRREQKNGFVGDVQVFENGSEKMKSQAKQRLILFVGNLKYTTSLEAIKSHFSACDSPPIIRLLTPKSKKTAKSKGCAFLEFNNRNALQQALKLHQSELEGRKINVELTAGGGGKSEKRLSKLKERNKELHGQRTKRLEKQNDANSPAQLDRPQRYSATSGVEQTPSTKRTWTVGDIEDGDTHRGGQKHQKRVKVNKPGRKWGTGVNAIPVG